MKAFKLSDDSQIVVTSVGPDSAIEEFWAYHRERGLLRKLADLGFFAMTTPNYSFMLDVPQTNAMYNLSRIYRMCERISAVGLRVIPHLNASIPGDWKSWEQFMLENPEIHCLSIEFQTGLQRPERGSLFFKRLLDIQDAIRRPIHPIVHGGLRYLRGFIRKFSSFTAVDATPFLKTMNRQVFTGSNGRFEWRSSPTLPGADLTTMLLNSIAQQRQRIVDISQRLEPQLMLWAA